ncbi:MAG TPA: type I polyketide synthase, partial [Leptolyngbyaceae cyanobacterium M65_K2018_010]|nr:type I polyketide synthase [Leptolyngbyaceae cyanobacterium M65_K2018_010]
MNDLARRISTLSPEQRLQLKVRLGEKKGVPEPIAIVGMGCRFPGAPQLQAYWQLLTQGQDAIRDIPRDRWPLEHFYDADPAQPGKHYCRQGGFLEQIDQFDPEFFGIAPREAKYIDPQQRLLLEVMWEALEDGAIVPQDLSGTQTGVFVGASTLDYGQFLLQQDDQIGPYTATGLASTMLANRMSYLLNFQGPSLTVDTACSSSLVAVHLACQSLWRGESTLALVGGVNVMITPSLTIGFSKLTALSPDGRCKAFDADANGFVRSEGAGAVVLKPLTQALAQGDRIYALIRGGAINQDGRTNGLTAPNREAQEQVLRAAYRQARVPLAQVSYIEAHGTGTLLGDPIEAKALGNVFGPSHQFSPPIRLGSVKSNIGHTEAAAGIAGLIKVALCLKHQTWVPSLHFHRPNPYIPFDQLPLRVQTEREPWRDFSEHAIAGVSSFGFGGTNAHLVLQAPPRLASEGTETPASPLERPGHLFTLSARSESALRILARQYLTQLQNLPEQELANLCYTANTGRTRFPYRLATWATTPTALQQSLLAFAGGTDTSSDSVLKTALPGAGEAPALVWLFTGQGAQYPGMGQQLYQTQPVFRAALERCDEILRPYLEDSLLTVLYPDAPEDPRLHQTAYTQPALFALEYALAELWRSWGVQPAAVLGHSVGEYVAACVAGVFSLEEGLKLIAQRGQLMQSLPANGLMAAVMADAETVAAAMAPYGEAVAIATLNGPHNTVVAGLREPLKDLLEDLKNRQIAVTPLAVSHAFHSPLMEPILNVFEHLARQVDFQPPQIPLVANLTGQFLAPGETPDATYWRRQARQPVRFAEGIASLHQQGYTHFLEIGPHPVLSRLGQQCLPQTDSRWFPSLWRQRDDWATLSQSLSQLYLHGVAIDWQGFDQPYRRRKLALPTYPFQR